MMATPHLVQPSTAENQIALLAFDALERIVTKSGTDVTDITMLVRQRGMLDDHGNLDDGGRNMQSDTVTGARGLAQRRQLAQLWAILAAVHATLAAGAKCTQRELWYRLKTTGLFAAGPPAVNERILDACAAISARCGIAVRRETLGVIAAPRGAMSGCVTLLAADGAPAQHLEESIFQVPGDTEAIRELRIDAGSSRARFVLVVEKDSVFRRLVGDRFTARVPSILITACGYPDLATRALVAKVVDALHVRAFALTDHNPHGLALMLAYKHGTANHGLESNCRCPGLKWIGLKSAHVPAAAASCATTTPSKTTQHSPYEQEPQHDSPESVMMMSQSQSSQQAGGGSGDPSGGLGDDAFQPFTSRDLAVLNGLSRRPEVRNVRYLAAEVNAMRKRQVKVEIEALYAFGFDYLSTFLERQILRADMEDEYEEEEEAEVAEATGGADERYDEEDYENRNDEEEEQWREMREIERAEEQSGMDGSDEEDAFLMEDVPDW